MSMRLAQLAAGLVGGKKLKRSQLLALEPEKKYDDGRTKQSFRDECDINLIMQRAAQGGTISHLSKYEGVYADYSDFDFQEHITKIARGETIFASLDAEIRREFGQNPQEFFDYVNDPANKDDLLKKLPGLAQPGNQLIKTSALSADEQAASAAASEPASANPTPSPPATPEPSTTSAGDG